jgi:hypothetical protein
LVGPLSDLTRVQAGPPKTLFQLFGGSRRRTTAVTEQVTLALGAARALRQCGPEPWCSSERVVRDQVHEDLEAEVMRSGQQVSASASVPKTGSMPR